MKHYRLKVGTALVILGLFLTFGRLAVATETTTDSNKAVTALETVTSSEETKTSETNASSSERDREDEQTDNSPVAPTEDSQTPTESSISQEDLNTTVEKVNALIEAEVGKNIKKVNIEGIDFSANYIREILKKDDYGITNEALDEYTDRQLEDTMSLFERYNNDISGMDFGAYVRLLSTLYVDKSVSVEAALAQLAFNPKSFSSFGDMIPEVERLQTYLSVLYPPNSSFISGKTLTNDELIATLQFLDNVEKQLIAEGKELSAGRIVYILSADKYDMSSTPTSDSTSESKQENATPVKALKKDENKEKGLRLPQTGEGKAKLAISVIGIVLILGVAIVILKRKKISK